jgi:hypothetical protein
MDEIVSYEYCPDMMYQLKVDIAIIRDVLSKCHQRDAEIFTQRLIGNTYKEMSEMFNLSSARIRQIYLVILRKLRNLDDKSLLIEAISNDTGVNTKKYSTCHDYNYRKSTIEHNVTGDEYEIERAYQKYMRIGDDKIVYNIMYKNKEAQKMYGIRFDELMKICRMNKIRNIQIGKRALIDKEALDSVMSKK